MVMGRPEIGTAAVDAAPDVAGAPWVAAVLAATMPKLGNCAPAALTVSVAVSAFEGPSLGAAAAPAPVCTVLKSAIGWALASLCGVAAAALLACAGVGPLAGAADPGLGVGA